MLRVPALLLLLAALAGCGGSDGGGAGNPDAGPSGNGDGGLPDAGTTNPSSIFLSETAIRWNLFQAPSETYAERTFSVHVRYAGDGVLIGYPPEVPRPAWLTVSSTEIQSPIKEFDFSFKVKPPNQAKGTYTTTLRFITGKLDGSQVASQDLAIRVDVNPIPELYRGSVEFQSISTDTAPPSPTTLTLDLSGSPGLTWSPKLESLNNGFTGWAALSPAGSTQLSVGIPAVRKVGQYEGQIVLQLEQEGAKAEYRIPLRYTVTPGRPEPRFVAPMAGFVNEPGTLTIRGVGFTTLPVQQVRIGGMDATSFTVVNDTELRAQYEAFATLGAKPVELVAGGRAYPVGMDYLIKDHPPAMAGDFTFPTALNHMVYDATRDVLIVSTVSTLYRLHADANGWSIETQRPLTWGRFDLTPDARYLIATTGSSARLLDAVTLADVETYPIPLADTPVSGSTWGNLLHMLNNGTALISAASPNFVLFDSVNRTLRRTNVSPDFKLTRTDHSRSRVFIAENSSFNDKRFTGFYDSTSDDFLRSPNVGFLGSNQISYSGNGERLLVDAGWVMTKDFTWLGILPKDDSIYNDSLELSPDGMTGYRVMAGYGKIYPFDLRNPPTYPKLPVKTFKEFSFYAGFPDTLVSLDGKTMFIGGGWLNGSTRESRLVIVPL